MKGWEMVLTKGMVFLFCLLMGSGAVASPKVDGDLARLEVLLQAREASFQRVPAKPDDTDWVKAKLAHMVDLDQTARSFFGVPREQRYTDDETKEFLLRFSRRLLQVDEANTVDLKGLLKRHGWFTVSRFGSEADDNAWLLVQHADHDPAFQKQVLGILSGLWPRGESRPSHFAYLYDRVAASWHDPAARKPQRYGTQGSCVGPGRWEPLPMEEPSRVDEFRAEMGLPPLAEYRKKFETICL